MRTIYLNVLCFTVFISFSWNLHAQFTVVQWNFNGESADLVSGGDNNPLPSVGSGSAELIGGVSGSFKSGGGSDPVSSVFNYAWNTSSYAPLGTGSKQRGVQFNISTVGFYGIVFKFDQRLSNTANTTYVVQYTADRTAQVPSWIDFQTFSLVPAANGTTEVWQSLKTVDLSSVSQLNDNPNVAIRIVSAFDATVSNYLSANSNYTYGTSGTVRYDMISVYAASESLSLNNLEQIADSFVFYPNPVKEGFVYFDKAEAFLVTDLSGKQILSVEDATQLDISDFLPGIYLLRNNSGAVRKLIRL